MHDPTIHFSVQSSHPAFGPRMLEMAAPRVVGLVKSESGDSVQQHSGIMSPELERMVAAGAFAVQPMANSKTIAEAVQFKIQLTEAYGKVTNACGGPFATQFYRHMAPGIDEVKHGRYPLAEALTELETKTKQVIESPPEPPSSGTAVIPQGSVAPVFDPLDPRSPLRPRA